MYQCGYARMRVEGMHTCVVVCGTVWVCGGVREWSYVIHFTFLPHMIFYLGFYASFYHISFLHYDFLPYAIVL